MLAMLALLLGGCTRENPPPSSPFPNAVESGEVDPYGLPLVIVIKPPEVPKEIAGPLPPVKEESPKPSPPVPLRAPTKGWSGEGTMSAGRIGK